VTADEPDLALGDSGEGVVLLQVRLYWLGFYPQVPDGTFDMLTETAVRDLQATSGQDNDGTVSRATWDAIAYWEQQYNIPYRYQSPYDALAQLVYDLQQAQQYATAAEPYAGYSEDGQSYWDGYTWWQWDGQQWQLA
jgi:peptidoglycan hydrolase-like protein with peptidoglycan-binding domain